MGAMKTPSLFPAGFGKKGQEETWVGEITGVVFHNRENGFTVLRLQAAEQTLTVVGSMTEPQEGWWIRVRGVWEENARWGTQLRILEWEYASPAGKEGLVRFLGGGFISGIGPAFAARMVEHFGEHTLEIIEKEPQRLLEVPGIGRARLKTICESYKKYRHLSEVFVFLQSYGVGPGTAHRIYNRYRDDSIRVLREDPYRLALEVDGIGFLTADRIARAMGVAEDAPGRMDAACLFSLQQAELDGHVCLPAGELGERTRNFLQCDGFDLQPVLARLSGSRRIAMDGENVYLPFFLHAEQKAAIRLAALAHSRSRFPADRLARLDNFLKEVMDFQLEPQQKQAVHTALSSGITVVTGGPGTGKTTLVRAITAALDKAGFRLVLAAPTGRAARRLAEATGHPAQTLHRLLEFAPQTQKFNRNRHNPLETDWVVVDEMSMVDLPLMYALLEAIPPGAALCCVGDVDQLPSVGPGLVLRDMIDSGELPVVRLQKIFRQAQGSMIVSAAHEVNEGRFESQGRGSQGDLFFIEREDPQAAARLVHEMATRRIPEKYGLDPMSDIQVLTPMHKGVIGTEALNAQLQETLNPHGKPFFAGGHNWRVGDRILQLRNNYDSLVFNGDAGRIEDVDTHERKVRVRFDERQLEWDLDQLSDCTLSYAISIHKSQGSEYPAVIVPIHTQHAVMLQRNLLYTAITRARRLVVIVGSRKALNMAIRSVRVKERYSHLRERIVQACAGT